MGRGVRSSLRSWEGLPCAWIQLYLQEVGKVRQEIHSLVLSISHESVTRELDLP